METQRRRSTRVDLDWAVTMESPNGMHCGTMRNLSLHGVFLSTDERVPLGENVAINFGEPGAFPPRDLRISAVVVRKEDGGVALALRRMDFDSLILLRSIVGTRVAEA